MAVRKALTTMVIGSDYKSMWEGLYRRSVEAYAERHDYELVIIDAAIDPRPKAGERTPHWQKCLILEHPRLRDREHVRSAERRVGKACVSTCRYWWSTYQ